MAGQMFCTIKKVYRDPTEWQHSSHSSQFYIISKVPVKGLYSLIQVIEELVNTDIVLTLGGYRPFGGFC